ncbi:family 78 glycoside hydrolase catalytic domain [Streptomyces sp. NPDC005760]|uniref:family 78 glycoside hydrolase catalytic domain n=1 Tax=Streptomyces sp. NPDC005760 TaxID=3156718 RepID=UPI0033CEFBCD
MHRSGIAGSAGLRDIDALREDHAPGRTPDSRTRPDRSPHRRHHANARISPTPRRRYCASPTCTRSGPGAALPVPFTSTSDRTTCSTSDRTTWAGTSSARGVAGTAITVRHAEAIQGGELCVRPLRSALAADHFILSGREDAFEPAMAFHGFRCVELTGRPKGTPAGDAVSADVIDVRPVLELSWCSLMLLRNTGAVRGSAGWSPIR